MRMQPARGAWLVLLALTGAAAAPCAPAQSPIAGSLGAVSDYIRRGLSQTCGDPAVQADVHLRSGGGLAATDVFAGVWGSHGLGAGDCGSAREIDAYAGSRVALPGDSSATLMYTHYAYPGGGPAYLQSGGYRYDYDELAGTWAYQDQLYATVAWTPDALRYDYSGAHRDRHALYYGLQLDRPVWAAFAVLAGIGYDEISDYQGTGFSFWNAGLGYRHRRLELDLLYVKTAPRAERLFGEYSAGGRIALAVLWRF